MGKENRRGKEKYDEKYKVKSPFYLQYSKKRSKRRVRNK
jgi:hypothetical protein